MKDITPDDLLLLMVADPRVRSTVANMVNVFGELRTDAMDLNVLAFTLGSACGLKRIAPGLIAKLPTKAADEALAKIINIVKGETP